MQRILNPAAAFALLLLLFAPLAAFAQGVAPPSVNPGAVLNESQREIERLQPAEVTPEIPNPVSNGVTRPIPVLPAAGGPSFMLRGVLFTPSAFLSPAELDAISRPFIGVSLDTAGIQRLVAAINALYDQKGVVTGAAIVPQQGLQNGVLQITLVEGRLGEARLSGYSALLQGYILRRLPLPPGEVLNLPLLDARIVAFNRTNDIHLKGGLQPGANPGFTDVDIEVQEPPRNAFSVFADNQGTDTTDENQIGFLARRFTTFFDADRISAYATWSRGSINGSLSYDAPVDVAGDRAGASWSQNAIKVVQGPYSDLDITGEARTGALTFTHPVLATAGWLIMGNSSLSAGSSTTRDAGVLVSDDRVYKATIGIGATRITPGYVASITQDIAAVESRDVNGQTRSFPVLNGSLSGAAGIYERWRLTAALNWQFATERRLPAALLLQLGGPTTVRGYRSNLLSGNSGAYGNLELHRDIPELLAGLDVFAFVDGGYASGGVSGDESISSTGFGLLWTPTAYARGEFAMAFPIAAGKLYGRVVFSLP